MGMPVTVKGQVTIPKAIRNRLGLVAGSRVEFEVEPDGHVVMRKAEGPPATRHGRFAFDGPAPGWNGMTTEEIMKLTRGEDWGDPA